MSSAAQNDGKSITFYLDDIGYDKPRLSEPRLLVSYQTINSGQEVDRILRNVAFTYDNALALMAFVAAGQTDRAKLIADALVYAQNHDRFYSDGRLRNAYQGGNLVLAPGWVPNSKMGTVRMPGWYGARNGVPTWLEDKVQVSTYTGNVAWAMLALLAYYDLQGGHQYLVAAERMGDWVRATVAIRRVRGATPAGSRAGAQLPKKLTYKSTEHNIDLYAAFQRLWLMTGEQKWHDRAECAKAFVLAMWDQGQGKFWTGTLEDGKTVNTEAIPVDIQAWALLALREGGEAYKGYSDLCRGAPQRGNGI